MKRTQIQLDEPTFEKLRRRAFEEKRSLAALVREILRADISPPPRPARRIRSSFSFIGSGRSRGKDAGTIAERHDEEFIRAIMKTSHR